MSHFAFEREMEQEFTGDLSRRPRRGPKPQVEWDGCWYSVRSHKTEIPDLKAMSRFDALRWLISNTYPRGYAKHNPLAGIGGAITVGAR